MRFPKSELNISEYCKGIKTLLNDNECAIFIDTNVISQLYRLNEAARKDFYSWIESCDKRFHVPVWAIHEYSQKVYTNKTSEYLSELSKIKTYGKDFANISDFIKGYVGESLLKGSIYQSKVDDLKSDVDKIKDLLAKIGNAINSNLKEHQGTVHKEIEEKLKSCALSSDIYTMMPNIDQKYKQRYENYIAPGYKDATKNENCIGDLVIWQEILDYCKKQEIKKVVLISRDSKPDIVYEPEIQIMEESRKASNSERIKIAKESLVYEFYTLTNSTDFYIIDFKTFVRLFASEYRELAKSFQIATAEEELAINNENKDIEQENDFELIDLKISDKNEVLSQDNTVDHTEKKPPLYSGSALIDAQYDTEIAQGCMDLYIQKLRSHNWYIQNPTIDEVMKIKIVNQEDSEVNRSSIFVLGRNILQSAEGSSGSAITFIENLSYYITGWEKPFKKALVDGIFYEIFFNSQGLIRPLNFKATFYEEIIDNILKLNIEEPFDFINDRLVKVKNRFVPKVGTNQQYNFVFNINDDGDTISLKCNDDDISDTFSKIYNSKFATTTNIKTALGEYYAIKEDAISVSGITNDLQNVKFIVKLDTLPF